MSPVRVEGLLDASIGLPCHVLEAGDLLFPLDSKGGARRVERDEAAGTRIRYARGTPR